MYNAPQSTKEINKVEIYKTEAEIHQETRREIPADSEHANEDKKSSKFKRICK